MRNMHGLTCPGALVLRFSILKIPFGSRPKLLKSLG